MTLTLSRLFSQNVLLIAMLAFETVGGFLETLPSTFIVFHLGHLKYSAIENTI